MTNTLLYTVAGLETAAACGIALGAAPAKGKQAPGAAKAGAAPVVLAAAIEKPGADMTAPAAGVPVKLTAEESKFFEAKVRPVLAANCYKCHSVEQGKAKGELTLDTREGLLKGGKHGAVIAPGHPEASPLIKAISYVDENTQMPPNGDKLGDKDIAALTEWVKMGAPDPRSSASTSGGAKLTGLTDKARQHWAYQPVKSPDVPAVQN